VCDANPDVHVLFTCPNADPGGYDVYQRIHAYCEGSDRAFLVTSLGRDGYLNAVAHAELVMGNSSSGIIEVPSLDVPTVNIGSRQQGRLAAESVIHAKSDLESIQAAVCLARNPAFKKTCQRALNPYGNGHVSAPILAILKRTTFDTVKPFYDWDISYAS
jgi:UDP-N-acetylglucosamine 2-epimerase (non-hydrolysing)